MHKSIPQFYVVVATGTPWLVQSNPTDFAEATARVAWMKQQHSADHENAEYAICTYRKRGVLMDADGKCYAVERWPYVFSAWCRIHRALYNQNYLVSKTTDGTRWQVARQRKAVSATVWDKVTGLPTFSTATQARQYVRLMIEGASLTDWSTHRGRGNAFYTAQNYTGPVMDGVELAKGEYSAKI